MKEEFIPKVSTPRIPNVSQQPASEAYREAHAEGRLPDAAEEEIAVTRIFILEKYSIPPENVLVFTPVKSKKPQRQIRAFSIIVNTENPEMSFYAEGHAAHVALNNAIIDKFGSKMGSASFNDLVDQETFTLKRPWILRKGFLDPFHSGFKEFPGIRSELIEQIEECKELNGLSDEECTLIENGQHELPNWFLSADSSKGS